MCVSNMACGESTLLEDLCTCNLPHSTWCFIHNKVNVNKMYSATKSSDFGFMCKLYPSPPLFYPGQLLECENLLQWVCEAHTMVSANECLNYQSARIKVPTELNIGN